MFTPSVYKAGANVTVTAIGRAIEFGHAISVDSIRACLNDLAEMPVPSPNILLANAYNLAQEKWDWTLSDRLLQNSFASLKLDIQGAHDWVKAIASSNFK